LIWIPLPVLSEGHCFFGMSPRFDFGISSWGRGWDDCSVLSMLCWSIFFCSINNGWSKFDHEFNISTCDQFTAFCNVYKIRFDCFAVPDEQTFHGLGVKFVSVCIGDIYECSSSKSTEIRYIRFLPKDEWSNSIWKETRTLKILIVEGRLNFVYLRLYSPGNQGTVLSQNGEPDCTCPLQIHQEATVLTSIFCPVPGSTGISIACQYDMLMSFRYPCLKTNIIFNIMFM
jgi:hypothetical protein